MFQITSVTKKIAVLVLFLWKWLWCHGNIGEKTLADLLSGAPDVNTYTKKVIKKIFFRKEFEAIIFKLQKENPTF